MNELVTFNKNGSLSKRTITRIVEIEEAFKKADEAKKALREQLLNAMAEHNIMKIDTDEMSVTLKQGSYRETFDTSKFKKDHEEMYNNYVKLSETKPSLLLKLK